MDGLTKLEVKFTADTINGAGFENSEKLALVPGNGETTII